MSSNSWVEKTRKSLWRLSFVLCLLALPSSLFALPDGFVSLEKDGLPFNGKQWVETGYCPTAYDRFECDVTVAEVQANASAAVFGTERELEPELTFAFYVRQNGDDSSVVAYGDTARGGFFPRGQKVSLSVGPDGATWTWAGRSDRLALPPGSARDGKTPLLIGDANGSSLVDESVPAGMGTVMNLHRFRIWRGGLELVHDYEPCRTTSGEIGLYDALERNEKARFKRLKPESSWWRVPYRTWDPAQMKKVDCVCTNPLLVTASPATFEGGQWYAVTGEVSRGTITVKGSAHLILCDGAKLVVTGGLDQAGICVTTGNVFTVYGQTYGMGELVATGGRKSAGIGSDLGKDTGIVTINGGRVTATGGWDGAGIGSGEYLNGTTKGNSKIAINGGLVKAVGNGCSAGIGGGWGHHGGELLINGGTIEAIAGSNGGFSLGDHGGLPAPLMNVKIVGGSVKADKINVRPVNEGGAPLYCVTVKWDGGESEEGKGLRLEGLDGYGTNDIFAVNGSVYLWLPNGTHTFSLSDGTKTNRYFAIVTGGDVTAERLEPVGFFANGTDVGDVGVGDGWVYLGKVLSLTNAMTYVLSGVATNGEVKVKATTDAAKVVLSNAFVFTSGRRAIEVTQGGSITVAADEMLRTGNAPEALRYVQDYKGEPCVRSAPCVTVTVKDIPHVSDVTVSNAVEKIKGGPVYRVMAGDNVFVGYTVEQGRFSRSANPLVYTSIASNVTVDAGTIETLPHLPYRSWNEGTGQIVDCVCSNYAAVVTDTTTFEDGQWYAVTGTVSCGTITVVGSAHLILCDGATLTCDGARPNAYQCGEPGILLDRICSLCVYGQAGGSGTLEALGAGHCAGIGCGAKDSPTAGALTVNGGVVLATGQGFGAGIGGSNPLGLSPYGNGGTVTINGGMVTAKGGSDGAGIGGGLNGSGGTVTINGGTVTAAGGIGGGAGIGGGYKGDGGTVTLNGGTVTATGEGTGSGIGGGYMGSGGSVAISGGMVTARSAVSGAGIGGGQIGAGAAVTINGGTVTADGGEKGGAGIGGGWGGFGGTVTIDGGSVKAQSCQSQPKNAGENPLYCVTAKCPGMSEEGRGLRLEGLDGYGTNDIFAVEGAVYLWLPNGTHRFAISDGETTYRYFAVVDGLDITVDPGVPVTPGEASGPYTTAEEATNAMWVAFIRPREDVAAVLVTDTLLKDYRNMFGFAVTGGGTSWALEAVLTPTARTNLAETATGATRQIPVAAIAQLPENVTTNVTVRGCAPGFFYSLYDGWALTNIVVDANATNLNVLCGADAKVVFPEVRKPSEQAGFFRVGVGVTDNEGKR